MNQLYKSLSKALCEAETPEEIETVIGQASTAWEEKMIPRGIYHLMLKRANLKLDKILEKFNP